MAASKGEQAMNPQYEAHERLCKSIGDMAKENEDLKHHVTELENRLRALWDKLEYERKHYMEQVRRLEEAGNNLLWNFCPEYTSDLTQEQSDALKQWNQAKEAKP
jgi:predicted RNase H-like nuclease (RuvC/YqgF family)